MTTAESPLISVIIPAFKAEKYISEAIDSILAQTYRNFELIIINDGSTDKTEKIILSYKDERIKYIKNQMNLGLAKSLNIGIKYASGKYIARLDADDIAARDRFEIQIKYLEHRHDIAVCGSYYQVFNKSKSAIIRWPLAPEQIKTKLFFENPVGHPTVMMRSSIFKKDSFSYDESFQAAQDFDLWCRISRKYNIANLPFVLTKYRTHESQISASPLKQIQADRKILIRQAEFLLKRKLTKEEQLVHFQLMGRTRDLNTPLLKYKQINNWANCLIKTNNSNNVYDQVEFKREMNIWLKRANVLNGPNNHKTTIFQTSKSKWKAKIKSEVKFWDDYFRTKGLQWPDNYKNKLDPKFPLQPRVEALLPPQVDVNILDVGAGPLSFLGKTCRGKNIHITPIDPLAVEYEKILKKYHVEPLIHTKQIAAEKLSKKFHPNTYDLVFARNCIDHAYNPVKAIFEMINVVKPGRYVLLEHRQNEATNHNFSGLHQWNFSFLLNGDFIISSKTKTVNISKKYKRICTITCEITNEEKDGKWLIIRIQKK